MSGFAVWNQAGFQTINSDQRHTVLVNAYTPPLIDVGAVDGNTPFGRFVQLGWLHPNYYPTPNNLYWFRLNAGAWCFPGAWMFQPNTVQFCVTSRVQALNSGYLDVMDGGGNLIWSANSAANMPRILSLLDINGGVDSAVQGMQPGFSPWILMGACPGNFSVEEVSNGYSGLIFRWDGATLQTYWVRLNQNGTFANTFGDKGGLRIPLAYFNGR